MSRTAIGLILLAGCYPQEGACDEASARTVVYSDDEEGSPAYAGQALLTSSCGDGSFCHSADAEGAVRFGAPLGLDFDLRLADSSEQSERLREDQIRVHRWRRAILRSLQRGSMPPMAQGEEIAALGRRYVGVPSIESPEGQEIVRNWLACGSPVVERIDARPEGVAPIGAIVPSIGSCEAGLAECGGRCLDVRSDPMNCGGCGVLCGAGRPCVDGVCSSGCAGSLVSCEDVCADLSSDVRHCGECAQTCGAGSVCFDGACSAGGCPPGTSDCGGSCVDVQTNASHCGECERACAGTLCEGGACACGDTSEDPLNCGSCGLVCPARATCQAGECLCPAGQSRCGDSCVDIAGDAGNCGGCGVACGSGQVCRDSACRSCGSGVSFARDVEPIFARTCGGSLCHVGRRPAGDLDLDVDPWGALVGQDSKCGRPLVTPGDATNSYLMNKLTGVDMCRGNAMPLREPPLPAAELAAIEDWICGGARND